MVDMDALCRDAKRLAKEGLPHFMICKKLADIHNLWDNDSRFPIWLSHVVSGIMGDENVPIR